MICEWFFQKEIIFAIEKLKIIMVAKIFYKLFLVLIVMMASLSISAETDTAHNSTQGNGSAVLNTHHERPKDLRMPSRNFLELQYSSGMLSLFYNYYEGDLSILLVNKKNLESNTFP